MTNIEETVLQTCFLKNKIRNGRRVTIEYPARLLGTSVDCHLSVGAYSYIRGGHISALHSIGRFCSIAPNLRVGDGMHPLTYLSTHPFQYKGNNFFGPEYERFSTSSAPPIQESQGTIGHDVWIGANVTIMRGINIGTGAVIGAGAVLTRDVAPYEIVGGVPAKRIRFRFESELIERLLTTKWWEYTLDSLNQVPFDDPIRALDEIDRRKNQGLLKLRINDEFVYQSGSVVQKQFTA